MARRNHNFAVDEHYHCYNRGVDKRTIFLDQKDYGYFLRSLSAYNTSEVLGKMRLQENKPAKEQPVTVLCYCLLPNHFHMVLRNNCENGISKYMQRVGISYTMYFNKKYNRSGSLFQGTYKTKFIETDRDLKQVIGYVRFNQLVHGIDDSKLYRSEINTADEFVRDLNSNFGEKQQKEVALIIKDLRDNFEYNR